MTKRSVIARDLRSPKYQPRIVPNKKRKISKTSCRQKAAGPYCPYPKIDDEEGPVVFLND